MKAWLVSTISLAALAAASPAQAAAPTELPDTLDLGRRADGEPCVASRYWNDPKVTDRQSPTYTITCRGQTGTRVLGVVRNLRKDRDIAAVDKDLACAAAQTIAIPGVGPAQVRRCVDAVIGLATVESRVRRNGRLISVSAVPTIQGPAEEAMRRLAGLRTKTDRNTTVTPVVDASLLAPAPGAEAAIAAAALGDSEVSLREGLRLIRLGLHNEASRTISDALARLPADAPVATRIELLLVAALADSNLRFFGSAKSYFDRADQLLAENPDIPDAAVLIRKRSSYGALDQLNQRQFNTAISALNQLSVGELDPSQPLLDPATLRTLNQTRGRDISSTVVTPDVAGLSQLVIDAQAKWAGSIALLAANQPQEAMTALMDADRIFAVLRGERVDQQQVRWLDARLEGQRARILARMGDVPGALAALDRAIASLQLASAAGAGFFPTLAETQLERAALNSRLVPRAQALAEFEQGVETLISSDAAGGVFPASLEQYLDLLIAEANANPASDAAERFFRAIQAVGNPAIARQFVQLQSVIAADGKLASKVRDLDEIEREITRLRFADTATPNAPATDRAARDTRRSELEAQLVALGAELDANPNYKAVNDKPVTLTELRSVLTPGEAFFKVTSLSRYAFGILVDSDGAQIYRVAQPLKAVEELAEIVRDSIDGGGENLPVFNVGASNALFKLFTGPVAERLLAAKAIVVDPSGPLEQLPIGVLVTDTASVESFKESRRRAQYDYSKIGFLARRAALSSALSPRSLLVARQSGSSDAPLPFIGFAEHMPVEMSGQLAGMQISIGSGCIVEAEQIAALYEQLQPIDKSELVRAGKALGLSQTPMVTGGEFTDTAVRERTDLDQFQVLHFATHGVTEGVWGCRRSPPALVTSLGGRGSDGILSFDEIAKLRLNANLVVLSACQTASELSVEEARAAGQEEGGATLEGLIRAFLAANSRAVLSTYWPISDEGESEALIENFYGAARSGTIGGALRTAQTELISAPVTSHPYYWGAFFVVGDANKPLLTGNARTLVAGASGSTSPGTALAHSR